MYVHEHVCYVSVYVRVSVYVCVYTCVYVRLSVRTGVYVCVHTCVRVSECVCDQVQEDPGQGRVRLTSLLEVSLPPTGVGVSTTLCLCASRTGVGGFRVTG